MKKILFVLSALLFCAATVSAQDIITKKSGEDIKAKVLEIDNSNVKYKLFDEPEGVTYTIPKSQILMIRYESGRNEVFNTAAAANYGYDRQPAEGIRAGMKYRELKHIYNYEDWRSGLGDRYNPALMGVCSWIIPGLGQMISGEVGRGFGWLGGMIGSSILTGVGSGLITSAMIEAEYSDGSVDYETTNAVGVAFMLAGTISLITIDICAIVDACRVAKVKNMYEQDLRKINYSFELHPSVNYIRMADRVQPTAGLTLAMRF